MESSMAKIYERNPDTDEVREREFGMYDENGMFTSAYMKKNEYSGMKEKDIIAKEMTHEEPPYRNYAREAIEILNRMERKIDALLEQKERKENE